MRGVISAGAEGSHMEEVRLVFMLYPDLQSGTFFRPKEDPGIDILISTILRCV